VTGRTTDTDPIEARLRAILLEPEPAIGNGGFSDTVMTAVRATKLGRAKAGRRSLVGTTVVVSLLTALFAAPLDGAFDAFAPGAPNAAAALAVLFVALLAIPAAWVFYSEG
jgi:hypothetical protein